MAHRCLKLPLDAQQLLRRVQVELASAVSSSGVLARSKIWIWYSFSMAMTCWLSADCDTNSFSAAREMLRSSAMASRYSSWRKGHNKTLLKLTG